MRQIVKKRPADRASLPILLVMTLLISSCSIGRQPLPLECTIDLVHDNMPYQDDEYVGSFDIYPRRLYLHCSVRNTSDKPVSLPFRSTTDTACASCFNVKINQSESLEVVVNERGHYDKYSIMPKETIGVQIIAFVYCYNDGELSKTPLLDLIPLIEMEYEQCEEDKSLSENEMADVHFSWNEHYEIRADKKMDRNNMCPP